MHDDAFTALELTDPPETAVDDDALLAQILATPVDGRPATRRPRRRLVVALVAGGLLVAVTVGWGYRTFVVDSKGLVPYLEQGRQGVPLPPGATWTPITDDTMPPNTFTNGPAMGRGMALLEAQCHWERYIVDSQGDPAATAAGIAGLRRIAVLQGENPGTATGKPGVERSADLAARGDLSGVQQSLAVACPPSMGGSATPLHDLQLSLETAGTPAVALILTYPGQRFMPDDVSGQVNTQVLDVRAQLDAAGLTTEPAEKGTGFWEAGSGVIMAQFHVSHPDAAAAIVAQAFAGAAGPDSRVLVWKGPKDTRTVPLH
jgi:hypothetical protein